MCVARLRERRNAHTILVEKSEKERDHFRQLSIDQKMALRCEISPPHGGEYEKYYLLGFGNV
jgi:hypothetical protein